MAHLGKHSNEEPGPAAAGKASSRMADQCQIDFELEFFLGVLERMPNYVDVLRLMSKLLTLKGRYAEGLQIDRKLVQLLADPLAHYNLACRYARLRRPDQCVKVLRRAVELGYRDFRYMREDRDLDSVRHDPRFRQLLKEYETPAKPWPVDSGQRSVKKTRLLFTVHSSLTTIMDILSEGDGVLFSDPSANRARLHFATKPRALTDKETEVTDAVRRLVNDGDYLAIGGFGADRIPTAAVHEVLRQNKQNLGFAGHTATHDFQILCAGNLTGRGQLLARVDIAYVIGLEARGLSPHGRRVMESGQVASTEWSNYILALRFKAAAMGLPFLPARSMLGTDTYRFSAAKEIACPFTGERLLAVPALYPDVAVIHVHEADRYGNCRLRGTSVADLDLARAARRLIITCERLIPNDEIRQDPTRTVIPFFCVDAVCEVPYGSYPGNMPYEYFSDEVHLRKWLDVERDESEYRRFLDEYIFGVKDFAEYLHKCGGLPRLQELRRQELLLHRGR